MGALTLLSVEVIGILYLVRLLIRRNRKTQIHQRCKYSEQHDPHQSMSSAYEIEGTVWVLEPEQVPKITASGDHDSRRNVLEVFPVRKFAKVKARSLVLIESDGSRREILLKGCRIMAVSASGLSSKKWAKRFPIKVESKGAVLYNGSSSLYIYLETSWEKESWCKALRFASALEEERTNRFKRLQEEFQQYLRSLAEGYPSLIKPYSANHIGSLDRATRADVPSSKVRQLWKKLSKKASKATVESKSASTLISNNGDKMFGEKSQDSVTVPSSGRNELTGSLSSNETTDDSSVSSTLKSSQSGSQDQVSELPGIDRDEKYNIDEGTLCWNLLISRLFFDAKSNMGIKDALKTRIQRMLSNMRTPSFIGELTCTDVDSGHLPPYIHGMRAVPTDMTDFWALELDIEYSGGAALHIEARLEELDLKNNTALDTAGSSFDGVTKDLLEGIEHLEEDLKLSGESNIPLDHHDDKSRSSKNSACATAGSRWKSILNTVAKQFSQVPFTLGIRVESLRGTLQLRVKPPPSDQLWFGFTSMPDINFHVDSFVGEHKVTSGHIALFLVNRFKAAIQETLVLPNCESICVPCMSAEKDDWVPRSVAPLIWLKREPPTYSASATDVPTFQSGEPKARVKVGKNVEIQEQGQQNHKGDDCLKKDISESNLARSSSSGSINTSCKGSRSFNDLRVPLLESDGLQEPCSQTPDCRSPSTYVSLKTESSNLIDGERLKRTGRTARMFDLGKRMTEKLEEKRRHIEEKSRHIVDKMRNHETG